MMSLVYIRIATHTVATVRHIMLQARFAAAWDCGLTKFGRTPGGGSKPGPSRSCSKVAIVVYRLIVHAGRRIMKDKMRKAGVLWGTAEVMGEAPNSIEVLT